jgi:hypothetical protein
VYTANFVGNAMSPITYVTDVTIEVVMPIEVTIQSAKVTIKGTE